MSAIDGLFQSASTLVNWQYFALGPVHEYSASTTLTLKNRVVKANTSGGSVTLTLPPASGNAGLAYFIIKVHASNSLILDGNASENINGATTLTMTAQYDSRIIVCDGDEWHAYGGGGGAGGIAATEFDAKGDLLAGTASDTFDNLAVGANGTVLEADSGQTTGLKWGSKEGGASAFRFHDDDLTASGTSVAMSIPGDTGLVEVTMPYAGSIVAVSVACQNARTAGTATFKPTINGTESSGLSAVLNGTNTQYAYGTQASGVDTFTAGQRVGVKVTTDGSWAAGATPSVDVEVFIVPSTSAPTLPTLGAGQVVRSSGDVTTTSAWPTLADLTGASIAITTTGGPVLLHFHCLTSNSGAGNANRFTFDRGGTDLASGDIFGQHNGTSALQMSMDYRDTPSAGTHTYKVRWAVTGGTGTVHADGNPFTYVFFVQELPAKGATT